MLKHGDDIIALTQEDLDILSSSFGRVFVYCGTILAFDWFSEI